MRAKKRSWIAAVVAAAALVLGGVTIPTASVEPANAAPLPTAAANSSVVPAASGAVPMIAPGNPQYGFGVILGRITATDPVTGQTKGLSGVKVSAKGVTDRVRDWEYGPVVTGKDGCGGEGYFELKVSKAPLVMGYAPYWDGYKYDVTVDQASLNAALEPGWQVNGALTRQVGVRYGNTQAELAAKGDYRCMGHGHLLENWGITGTPAGGGGNQGGGGEGSQTGNPAKLLVKKGIVDPTTGDIQNSVVLPQLPAVGEKVTVTSKATITNNQTALKVWFSDTTDKKDGGTVQWQKCTKYTNDGKDWGTHQFTGQPNASTQLFFTGGEKPYPNQSDPSFGSNMSVVCEGELDLTEVRNGKTHQDTATFKSEGSYGEKWTSSQTFAARVTDGTVQGTITEEGTGNPIEGVTATLYRAGSTSPELSVLSESDGTYAFSGGIAAGSYRVEFEAPDPGSNKTWTWVDPADGKSADFAVNAGDVIVQDGVAKLEDNTTPPPPPPGPGPDTGTWLTKSPARVTCNPADSDTCDITWDIIAYNGSPQPVSLATFTDVTSKEVYDVEATVRAPVAQLATGAGYTLALAADGTIWAFGNNSTGQLGVGNNTSYGTPKKVVFSRTGNGLHAGETVVQVVAANTTSYAMTSEGRVFAWGLDSKGQLGTGAGTDSAPRVVQGVPSDFVYIAAGNQFTVGLTASGDVWTWGDPADGRLGNGQSSGNATAPAKVLDGSTDPVLQISAGFEHTLAVTASGAIYVWGKDTNGKLGLGTCNGPSQLVPKKLDLPEKFVQVAAGKYHSMALSADGDVYTWGNSYYGVLGYATPTSAPTCNSYQSVTTPTKVPTLSGIFSITAGQEGSYAVASDGEVWSWGRNNQGQLGIGSFTPTTSATPMKVILPDDVDVLELRSHSGSSHLLMLGSDGGLYGWGGNGSDQLGTWSDPRVPKPVRLKDTSTTYLNLGNTDTLELMVPTNPTQEITESQLPAGCDKDDGTPQCAPRKVTFVERKYVSTEHQENKALNLRPHSRAFITVSGKVDRGKVGYTIGNQAYYDSDQAPFSGAHELKPLFPEFDLKQPWLYGVWEGGTACVPGETTACDQVWASVPPSINFGWVYGVVSRGVPKGPNAAPMPNVKVELYEGDPENGGTLIDTTYTNALGRYAFEAPNSKEYYVKFISSSLPKPQPGYQWAWVQYDYVNPVDLNGVSAKRSFEHGTDGFYRIEQNAWAQQEEVLETEISIQKGWRNPAGDIIDTITYGGDTKGQLETITVEFENIYDDTLTDFQFTDATDHGDDVVWSRCEVFTASNLPTARSFDLGDVTEPEDMDLTGIALGKGEKLICEGTLPLDKVVDDGHQDTVRLHAECSAGMEYNGTGTFTAKASDGQLAVAKGVLVDAGTTNEKIESNHYIAYGESETVTVRVTNDGDKDFSDVSIVDTTVEGPDVTGLDTSCSAIQDVAVSGSSDCTGSLTMDAYKHQNTVTVTAMDEDGGIHKTFADFEAQSGGTLPRAGMFGIWGFVFVGGALLMAAGIARSKRMPHTPQHMS